MDYWDRYLAEAKAREMKRIEARNKRLAGERTSINKQAKEYTAKQLAQADRQERARIKRMRAETKTLATKKYTQLFGESSKATNRVIWPYEIHVPKNDGSALMFSDEWFGTAVDTVVNVYQRADQATAQANEKYKITRRLTGALQAVGGGLTAVGSATLVVGSAAACPETGVACLGVPVGYAGMSMGSDQFIAGIKTVWTGQSQNTMVGTVIAKTTGISQNTAELSAGLLTLSPAVVEVQIYNQTTKAMVATNAWVRGTYNGTSHVAYEGNAYRYVDPKYANSSSWQIHPGNVGANHRYTEPGTGGLYVGTAEKTAAAEVKSYPAKGMTAMQTLATKKLIVNNVKITNILDLTNPAARQALSTTLKGITNTVHGGDAYVTPQRIAEWAISQGYKGILAPSAQLPKAPPNLILFDSIK